MKQTGYKQIMITPVRVEGVGYALNADGKLPTRIKILSWGDNPNFYGLTVRVGQPLVDKMRDKVYPWHKVALDFEHNTLPGTTAYKESSEPRSVAGFGVIEVVEGDGVYLCMDKYTPEGAAKAANYCDVSASPALDAFGNVIAIKSVALCRNGAVPEMDFVEVALSVSASVSDLLSTTKKTETNMDKLRAWIAKLLGKDPATVTEDEMIAGLEAKVATPVADPALSVPVPVADAAALSVEAISKMLLERMTPVQEQVAALSASFAALQGASVAGQKQGIIDEARRAGKAVTLPEAAVAALSVEQVEEHCKGLAITIPVDQRTPAHVSEQPRMAAISEQDRVIALNCGLDPDVVFGKSAAKQAG